MNKSVTEQLELKQKQCKGVMESIVKNSLDKRCAKISIRQSWLKDKESVDKIFKPIVGWNENSEYYRNKTEYTITLDKETN